MTRPDFIRHWQKLEDDGNEPIPLFNDAQNLPALLLRTEAACRQLGLPYEIILVDDGSRDGTSVLSRLPPRRPPVGLWRYCSTVIMGNIRPSWPASARRGER